MCDPVVIGMSPNRPNIYLTIDPSTKFEDFTRNLSDSLKKERLDYSKTIVFCRSYNDCAKFYTTLIGQLGKEKTEPSGYPDFLEYRLITMYTRASTAGMKEKILTLFSNSHSKLRVLVATTAFSMGIDMPDIHQILHWGAPNDLEQYLQEIGRSGRDGKDSRAILFTSKGSRYAQHQMKLYCENKDTCRRQQLFGSFILYQHTETLKCKCCDICAQSCSCDACML